MLVSTSAFSVALNTPHSQPLDSILNHHFGDYLQAQSAGHLCDGFARSLYINAGYKKAVPHFELAPVN